MALDTQNLKAQNIKVVAHGTDGTLVKGSTQDFNPDRDQFRVVLPNGVDTVPVNIAQQKAVFFVKRLEGSTNPRMRQRSFSPSDGNRGNGRPVAVQFADGELMVGYTHSYSPRRQGFFILPADPRDNNLRIFVVRSSAKALEVGPRAEELVRVANPPSESNAA